MLFLIFRHGICKSLRTRRGKQLYFGFTVGASVSVGRWSVALAFVCQGGNLALSYREKAPVLFARYYHRQLKDGITVFVVFFNLLSLFYAGRPVGYLLAVLGKKPECFAAEAVECQFTAFPVDFGIIIKVGKVPVKLGIDGIGFFDLFRSGRLGLGNIRGLLGCYGAGSKKNYCGKNGRDF